MKYSEFLKGLQNRTIPPVVTFLGEERFLKSRALEAVVARFLDAASRQYQFRTLGSEDLKDSSFLDEAATIPMFGEWKVMYVRDTIALERNFARIKDRLEQYLGRPCSETILIFDADSWEGRSKLKALLSKKTAIVEFNPLSEREIPSWIVSHLRTYQFQIESAAVESLSERIGPDLQKIASELEKLMLLRQSENKIRLVDVEGTVGFSPTATVWEWMEAILDQDVQQADNRMNQLLEREESAIYCVVVLARTFEKMILTKEMVQERVPQATIAQKINKPVFYLKKYLDQVARFTMSDLVKGMRVLYLTDRALKTSLAGEQTVMQLMTAQLCNLKAPAVPVFDVPLQ
jgi:DNA polymerase-3 subunit delta